jgi:hypothetical protein
MRRPYVIVLTVCSSCSIMSFSAHDDGSSARCQWQRTQVLHVLALRLVIRAESVCDRLTAVMMHGEQIQELTDWRFVSL